MRRSPQQVRPAMHQRGARVPSGVQFDMPYPTRLHGVPPVPRQDDRRVRFAGLVAHHILVRTRPKGQSFRRLTCLGRSKHGHEAIRQWQYSSGCRRPRVVSTERLPAITLLFTTERVLAPRSTSTHRKPAISPRLRPDSASSHAWPSRSSSTEARSAEPPPRYRWRDICAVHFH
jgi:sugar/nucleoside kinase (ribokinase family)